MGQILFEDNKSSYKASQHNGYLIKLIILLILIGVLIIVVNIFHLEQYVENQRLRNFIASYGMWAPIVYLLIWIVAPFLFIPVTPLLIMGGLLFGPIWGEIYVLAGATASAVVAFLVARYLARDFVANKLATTLPVGLDDQVARHGWKIIIISRIQPIFPYFLINIAFGLTKISLSTFIIATFFGLIPLTTAYVLFSANLIDLLKGNFSWEIFLALFLIFLAILSPVIYRQLKKTPPKKGIVSK